MAFAALWEYVGTYVGPSDAGDGHVGCVLEVTGKTVRTNNRHYWHADRLEVIAVLLRPWLFDTACEIGGRQSCANHRLNPYEWGGGGRPAQGAVAFKLGRDLGHERILGVRVRQQRADGEQDLRGRGPVSARGAAAARAGTLEMVSAGDQLFLRMSRQMPPDALMLQW